MEEEPNFVLKLSLEEMALRRVVVNLWNETDVLRKIQNFPLEKDWLFFSREIEAKTDEPWRETVEAMVKDKTSKLALPEYLKTRMMLIVRPIGLEILEWKIFHERFKVPVSEQLCWTSAGVLDYEKTAEKIVRLETLDVMTRYKLACSFCLEDHIRVLWQQLSREGKNRFSEKLQDLHYRNIPLELCWPYILNGEQSKLDNIVPYRFVDVTSFHEYAFLNSACAGNKGATQYFLQKLPDEERDSILLRAPDFLFSSQNFSSRTIFDFSERRLSDVLFYLLSQMSPEGRIQILKRQPVNVLNCLLDWPWQELFLHTADFVWTFLPESWYFDVFYRIRKNNRKGGYSFPKLFQDFILRSPGKLRKQVVCSFDPSEISGLIEPETIQLILRNADIADRVELVSSYGFFTHVGLLAAADDWHSVQMYLREAMLSSEDKEIVEESCMEFAVSGRDHEQLWKTNILERFFQILDET